MKCLSPEDWIQIYQRQLDVQASITSSPHQSGQKLKAHQISSTGLENTAFDLCGVPLLLTNNSSVCAFSSLYSLQSHGKMRKCAENKRTELKYPTS